MADAIRMVDLKFGKDVESRVLNVLRSGHIAQGPEVERLEDLCAKMANSNHAIAVSSGSAALDLAVDYALDSGPGRRDVITTPLTFAATLNAILRQHPVTMRFADVDDDGLIDIESVRALVGGETEAIVPVHLYGLMADMGPLSDLRAGLDDVALIEDAAQAHGASRDGLAAGSVGTGCFSFYATKNVTSGEGGVITTNDDEAAAWFRRMRNQGQSGRYEFSEIGHNCRMTDLQAAVLIPQMERLGEINATRRQNAAALSFHLASLGITEGVRLPRVPPGAVHGWHQYTVNLPDGTDRDAVQRAMLANGVETAVHYPRLVWDHPAYRKVVKWDDPTPNAQRFVRTCLSLPIGPHLGPAEMEQVARAFQRALSGVPA